MTTNQTNSQVFREIKQKQDELVLAATDIAAIIFPYGTDVGPIVDDVTGDLLPLAPGGMPLGEIQKAAGVELSPEMSTEGVSGYGSRAQRRVFVTEEGFTINLTVQEITKMAYQMFMTIKDEDIATEGKVTRMQKRASGNVEYYTLVLIAKDLARNGDIFPFWIFPKVAVTQKGQMSLAEASEMGMPLTFTVFEDDGLMFEIGLGGPGWPELAEKAGFTVGTTADGGADGTE